LPTQCMYKHTYIQKNLTLCIRIRILRDIRIRILMANFTLYIPAMTAEQFNKETNKSGLVTRLLDNHYGTISKLKATIATPAKRTKAPVVTAPAVAALTGEVCKNGHPSSREAGRCFNMSCPYSL
jgi:hypothetical protein